MTLIAHEVRRRANWLAYNILPHEAWLRRQLARNNLAGLDLDDIMQEAYACIVSLPSVDHIQQPRAYFFQTTRNIILQHVRSQAVVPIDAIPDIERLAIASEDPPSDEWAAAREELDLVLKAIAKLPPKCREVFMLRRVHGLSQRETALQLGVSESNVEKHIGRGIILLRDFFEHYGKHTDSTSMEEAKDAAANVRKKIEQRDR